jgi:Arc/MetJ-type ribon-helix-helix transcriptional regulator
MTTRTAGKQSFGTRLSQSTLARLDELVQRGRFKTRTAAIEAAVDRLYQEEQEYEQKREALDRACGSLSIGIDRAAWEAAELDRLEWEVSRNTGRWRNP